MRRKETQDSSPATVHYGPLWRRFLAFSVDLALLSPGLILGGWVWASLFEVVLPSERLPPLDYVIQLLWGQDPLVLGGFLFLLGLGSLYFLLWPLLGRSTPGLRLLGLSLVDEDGEPIGPGAATIRALGAALSAMYLWLGFLWILFDPKRQGFHDKIAGTYVVRRNDW